MILHLEYTQLKNEAANSLSSLFGSFQKRIDFTAEKSADNWATDWKKYREGEGGDLEEIITQMPQWMQYNFQHFANLQQFLTEIEEVFFYHDDELKEAYRRGKEARELVTRFTIERSPYFPKPTRHELENFYLGEPKNFHLLKGKKPVRQIGEVFKDFQNELKPIQ